MTDREASAVFDPLVSIQELTVRFGSIVALDKVSFDIPREGTYGLIGPNGAGKTTLFNCLSPGRALSIGRPSYGWQKHGQAASPCHPGH